MFAAANILLLYNVITLIKQMVLHSNKTNDLILNLTPENMTQHSRIERQLHTK